MCSSASDLGGFPAPGKNVVKSVSKVLLSPETVVVLDRHLYIHLASLPPPVVKVLREDAEGKPASRSSMDSDEADEYSEYVRVLDLRTLILYLVLETEPPKLVCREV